jgi:membrane protease YdiL (CAAX protease family)
VRPIRLLLIYLAFIFLGAALAAPWIYQFIQLAADQSPVFQKNFREIAQQPFHRYVNRSLIIFALVGLYTFLRFLGIRHWKDLGFAPIQFHWKNIFRGFGVGFLSLAVLAALAILFHARKIDFHSKALVANLLGATLTAIVVAVLEETLFRGALFGSLRKTEPWPMALVVSSAIYALAHFFPKTGSTDSVTWQSGFAIFANPLSGFTNLQMFLNLLIVGSILALMFQRTGNLYFSIGLHAGWIFWLGSYRLLTQGSRLDPWFFGSAKMIDGWLATIVLLTTFGILFYCRREKKDSADVIG